MPDFQVDWTSHHFADWSRWLGHLRGAPCLGLEIGCFEGRSAVWFLVAILTHPQSHLVCVDPWGYADEHACIPEGGTFIDERYDWDEVAERFARNTAPWAARRTIDRRPSRMALHSMPLHPLYDWVYIDGSHIARCVLEDSVYAWPLLKPGGILIWDDYDWTENRPGPDPELTRPKIAIDAFLRIYSTQYDQREQSNSQMKVRKLR